MKAALEKDTLVDLTVMRIDTVFSGEKPIKKIFWFDFVRL
jgi:hypothetical protein